MPDPAARYRRAVVEYRDGARSALVEAVILRRLIEVLPEAKRRQRGDAVRTIERRGQRLGAGAGTGGGIRESGAAAARAQALDAALTQATEDLRELGYWLPKTILENGVLS